MHHNRIRLLLVLGLVLLLILLRRPLSNARPSVGRLRRCMAGDSQDEIVSLNEQPSAANGHK